MTIVHVVEPFASGIATFVKSLVENLQGDLHYVVHGERKQVMRSELVKQDFPQENVRFIRWASAQREINLRKDLAAFWELYGILKRLKKLYKIDAVHLHSSKSGFLGRLACRLAKIDRIIYTPNGAPFLTASSVRRFLYRQLERLGSVLGGKVVCCSPSECDAYRELGIDAMNINNGVPLYKGLQPRSAAAVQRQTFKVVTCGRIVGQKDPALFNRIAAYFEEFGDFEFIWVGDGEERHLLTAKNITVTGWLSALETQAIVSKAQMYISTSFFEGMPFAVLEALVLRKPVLLKDCVGNRDVVKGGVNGDLFEEAEEATLRILRYYTNQEMLPVMGEYSRRYCEEAFDVKATFRSYRNLYQGYRSIAG